MQCEYLWHVLDHCLVQVYLHQRKGTREVHVVGAVNLLEMCCQHFLYVS